VVAGRHPPRRMAAEALPLGLVEHRAECREVSMLALDELVHSRSAW